MQIYYFFGVANESYEERDTFFTSESHAVNSGRLFLKKDTKR